MKMRSTRGARVPTRLGVGVLAALALGLAPHGAHAGERELDEDQAPSSAREIETPIERLLDDREAARPLFPALGQGLEGLPTFFADTRLEARLRTYYLRKNRSDGEASEAWAYGGSLAYHSGWLADRVALEAEGFTSQRAIGADSRGGTGLLEPVQDGYSVLGIANAKLRSHGLVLTGYRQYLDLPYVNRQDSRMIPTTFEALTLAKPEGALRFSAGYAWKVKLRTSDRFLSFTEAIGLEKERGLVHAGAVWRPEPDFHVGVVGIAVPDLATGVYSELGIARDLGRGFDGRFDAQLTYEWENGDDLLGDELDDTWSVGMRGAASRGGAVARLGFSMTGPGGPVTSRFGTNPSYVDLMQRTFTRADEKAVLVSASYDFSALGLEGLSAILNLVAAFDGEVAGARRDGREIDATLDYRIERGAFRGLWLRVRGSWLWEEDARRHGSDFRVILRYDLPVL